MLVNTVGNMTGELLPRDALPEWARRLVDAFEEALQARRFDRRFTRDGEVWRLPSDEQLWLSPAQSRPGFGYVGVLWLLGLVAVAGGVLSLRWGDGIALALWIGLPLLVVGHVLAAFGSGEHGRDRLVGLVLSPYGLLTLERGGFRVVPRGELHDARAERDRVVLSVAGHDVPLDVTRHTTAGRVKRRAEQLRALRDAGALPDVEGLPAPPPPRNGLLRDVGVRLGLSALLAGFVYLTGVYPTRSASGQFVQSFVQHLVAGEDEAAHAMLSAELRAAIPRERLRQELPPPLKRPTGFSVNSVSSSIGTLAGPDGCVDGPVEGPEGGHVAFAIVTEDDAPRIAAFRPGHCRR